MYIQKYTSSRAGHFCRAEGRPGGSAAHQGTEQHPFHLLGHRFWMLGTSLCASFLPLLLFSFLSFQEACQSAHFCRAEGRPGGSAARNGTEQHPFHLHGHHFWVLGSGIGPYNSSVQSTLNLVNPIYRDTQIVYKNGWAVLRFVVSIFGALTTALNRTTALCSQH